MARRSTISTLPEAVRAWLDAALVEGNFSGYELLEDLIRDKGYQISKSAIHRYGQPLQRRLEAIKASTEAARIITEGAADDQDARSEAVIALVQTDLFEAMIALQEAQAEDIDPAERLKLLSTAGRCVADVSRASVGLKRYQAEMRARVTAAADAAERIATKGGLSADAVAQLRREILGVAT